MSLNSHADSRGRSRKRRRRPAKSQGSAPAGNGTQETTGRPGKQKPGPQGDPRNTDAAQDERLQRDRACPDRKQGTREGEGAHTGHVFFGFRVTEYRKQPRHSHAPGPERERQPTNSKHRPPHPHPEHEKSLPSLPSITQRVLIRNRPWRGLVPAVRWTAEDSHPHANSRFLRILLRH